jgi:hypothetical protein
MKVVKGKDFSTKFRPEIGFGLVGHERIKMKEKVLKWSIKWKYFILDSHGRRWR